MSSNLHPLFQNILGAHGAVAYQNVAATTKRCTICVERIEVTIHPEHLDPRDVYFDRTGLLTDDQTQRAYDLLLQDDAVCAKLDAIAVKLARGDV